MKLHCKDVFGCDSRDRGFCIMNVLWFCFILQCSCVCVCACMCVWWSVVLFVCVCVDVFQPPQPAGSCVDSGWLKCRSERRQPPNQPFPSPLSPPPSNPAFYSAVSALQLLFNPALAPRLLSFSSCPCSQLFPRESPVLSRMISLSLDRARSSCQLPNTYSHSMERLRILCVKL